MPSLAEIACWEKPLQEYFHPGSWCRVARKCGETDPSLVAAELQSAIGELWDAPIEGVWRFLLRKGMRERENFVRDVLGAGSGLPLPTPRRRRAATRCGDRPPGG